MEQVDECLFFGPERAVVGVDQHVPHDLTLGGAFFEHQMELVQRPLGHGRHEEIAHRVKHMSGETGRVTLDDGTTREWFEEAK